MDSLDQHGAGAAPATGLAAVQAWRARGADRADPVRFRFIEAMAQRAAVQQGQARQLLDARVAALLAAYGQALEQAPPLRSAAGPAKPAPGPLAALTAALAQHAAAQAPAMSSGLPPSLAGPAELKSAHYFRSTWSRLSAQRRLTESLARLPDNAGPLNSHRLVHRALSLMRELSPGYLQRFMSHVDALMWLEQAQAATPASGRDAPKGKAGKKGRGKPG
ncbi:DUF2894 domain-containing protein [Pseudorhodoferax sp. Leaf267]|uniref:DUF2894 domain-containing protein n=1 Tax=Pseudorhodoferax sp. Leaf267 TaxID=1736316 RepID=UPI000701BD53|nr:DUF2894 domain-containing protein [Pseudorhodoferax sp. Leaf267]KQP18803.1 hypothetical protein ASF43_29185 [Pseudorhodoferax sp. Leaf267]